MTQYYEHRMPRAKKYVKIAIWFILGIFAAIAFALITGLIIMWLWNWLMPEIFGLATINYWQAVGLIILAKFLFGGFRSGRSNKRYSKFNERFNEKYKSKFADTSKHDFAKWKYYKAYWDEEGQNSFNDYIERKKSENF